MNDDAGTTTDGFDQAVAETLAVLRAGAGDLHQLRSRVDEGARELTLMQLQSQVLLADHRGRHLFTGDPTSHEPVAGHEWHTRLVAAHDQLIYQTTARTSFEGLRFVNEVAELCREVGRHVDGA